MFFAAIFINILTFILTQISIENGARPQGDLVTGFLYNGISAGTANIIITIFYFGVIFGLFYLVKSSERKINRSITMSSMYGWNTQRLLQKRKSNSMFKVASAGWLLYILMSVFNLMSFAGTVIPLN